MGRRKIRRMQTQPGVSVRQAVMSVLGLPCHDEPEQQPKAPVPFKVHDRVETSYGSLTVVAKKDGYYHLRRDDRAYFSVTEDKLRELCRKTGAA